MKNFKTLLPNITTHIILYTFPKGIDNKKLFNNPEFLWLAIISLILMPSICDSTVTLKGETEYWSLLGVKGFKQQQFTTLSHIMTLYYKTTVYPVVEIILSKIVLVLEPRFAYLKTYGKNNFSKAMCRWICNRIFWINPKNSRETTLLSWKHQGWMIHIYSSVKTASFQNMKPDNTAKKYFLYTM